MKQQSSEHFEISHFIR
uniref:Uncharacterized protein n=1 Tax=Arundo donax TaxID=35708 RepID=A0A0A8ZT46_ARUDO